MDQEKQHQLSRFIDRHDGVSVSRLRLMFDKAWEMSMRVGTCGKIADQLVWAYKLGLKAGKLE